jgi:Na+-transporting NADH:ubiquinone oxidoreductase subunit C
MDINSNKYTYIFSIIMVVVVAAMLSYAAISLKPAQDANIELEKKQEILSSINVIVTREEAGEAFDKYIKSSLVIRNGEVVENPTQPAFEIDMATAASLPSAEREVPLFVANVDGKEFYIIPMRGKGLWGPVWGNLSLEKDGNTVYGASFGHKGETPGLGAEISTALFSGQFVGKKIMDQGNFVSIAVIKAKPSTDHEVQGISGGTITSVGVESMLKDCLSPYVDYLKTLGQAAPAAAPVMDTVNVEVSSL